MPIDPSQLSGFASDELETRSRRCGKCGNGRMKCSLLIQHQVNGGDAGREYLYRCLQCGHTVQDYSLSRVAWMAGMLVAFGGLGALLSYYGAVMLISTVTSGWGGNDPAAMVLVLAVFLGCGALLDLGGVYALYSLYSDWNDRRQSPLLPPGT